MTVAEVKKKKFHDLMYKIAKRIQREEKENAGVTSREHNVDNES